MAADALANVQRIAAPHPAARARPAPPARGLPPARGMSPAPNPLLNPNQPLQGRSLQQAAQALTDAQTKGPLTELARQLAQNNRQGAAAQKLSAGYFNQLGQFANQGSQQEGQIAGGLNSQLQGIQNDTQGKLAGFGQQATQTPGLQSLAASGLDGGALGNLTAEIARQQGVAAQNAGTFRAAGANQGANYQGLAAQNLGVYGLRGQERLGNIAQATRLANEPINSKVADLQASRGSLLATNEGKLRQQEISNRVTQQGLGLKAQSQALTQQNNLANQQLAAQRIQATLNGQNVSLTIAQANNRLKGISNQIAQGNLSERQRHDLANEQAALLRAQGKASGGLTTLQANRLYGQIGVAQQLIKDAQSHGLQEAQIRGQLQSGSNPRKQAFDPAIIDSAFALNGYGFLTAKQVSELNKLGLHPIGSGRYKQGTPPSGIGTLTRPGATLTQ